MHKRTLDNGQVYLQYKGNFYQFHDYPLSPKPLVLPGRPWPLIFQGGNSIDAREDKIKFAVNGFAIAKETEAEAIQLLQEIQGKADKEAVKAFGEAVKQAGSSTGNKKDMWVDGKFEDLVSAMMDSRPS